MPSEVDGAYGDFDVAVFHAAVDEEREARTLTWAGVARELNRPIAHLSQVHPYSASTLAGMTSRRADLLNPHMVMNLLRWLGRTAESFVPGHPDAAMAAMMADDAPRGLGRWDFSELHHAIQARCVERGITMADAAAAIGVPSASLHKVEAGRGTIGVRALIRMAMWLGRPATDFFT